MEPPKKQNIFNLLYLICCALYGTCPNKEIIETIDLDELYELASIHHVDNTIAFAIEHYLNSGYKINQKYDKVVSLFKNSKEKAIRRVILFDAERNAIFSWFDKNKIWYTPLKGIILKDLYPKYGMRYMFDNDILFDEKYRKELNELMSERGYRTVSYNLEHHDVYAKDPIYNFEFHVTLTTDFRDSIFSGYYKGIENKIEIIKNSYKRLMSNEDFYIFDLVHSFVHLDSCNISIRSLIDAKVMIDKLNLDFNYVDKETKKIKINEFERTTRSLVNKTLGKDSWAIEDNKLCLKNELSDEERKLLEQIFEYKTGVQDLRTFKNHFIYHNNSNDTGIFGKLKYYFSRLIPKTKMIIRRYPICGKYKVLIPVFVFVRIITALFNFKQTFSEIKTVEDINKLD